MLDLERALHAFHDELLKTSAVPWQQLGHSIGALGGAGAAIGAGVNGLREGYNAYQDARDQGSGELMAGVHGLFGGASGAIRGGIVGGLAGGAAGAAGTHFAGGATKSIADKILANPVSGFAGRFGQRQVHGLTGWAPEGGAASIGVRGPEGMTSLPDIARSLRSDPGGTFRKGFTHQWQNSDALGKAMMGLSGAGLAYSALGPEDPQRGRAERIGGDAAGLAAGVLTGGLSTIPQMASSALATQAGARAGRMIDRFRRPAGPRHPEYNMHLRDQETNGMTQPVERNMSPAAAGQVPEVT